MQGSRVAEVREQSKAFSRKLCQTFKEEERKQRQILYQKQDEQAQAERQSQVRRLQQTYYSCVAHFGDAHSHALQHSTASEDSLIVRHRQQQASRSKAKQRTKSAASALRAEFAEKHQSETDRLRALKKARRIEKMRAAKIAKEAKIQKEQKQQLRESTASASNHSVVSIQSHVRQSQPRAFAHSYFHQAKASNPSNGASCLVVRLERSNTRLATAEEEADEAKRLHKVHLQRQKEAQTKARAVAQQRGREALQQERLEHEKKVLEEELKEAQRVDLKRRQLLVSLPNGRHLEDRERLILRQQKELAMERAMEEIIAATPTPRSSIRGSVASNHHPSKSHGLGKSLHAQGSSAVAGSKSGAPGPWHLPAPSISSISGPSGDSGSDVDLNDSSIFPRHDVPPQPQPQPQTQPHGTAHASSHTRAVPAKTRESTARESDQSDRKADTSIVAQYRAHLQEQRHQSTSSSQHQGLSWIETDARSLNHGSTTKQSHTMHEQRLPAPDEVDGMDNTPTTQGPQIVPEAQAQTRSTSPTSSIATTSTRQSRVQFVGIDDEIRHVPVMLGGGDSAWEVIDTSLYTGPSSSEAHDTGGVHSIIDDHDLFGLEDGIEGTGQEAKEGGKEGDAIPTLSANSELNASFDEVKSYGAMKDSRGTVWHVAPEGVPSQGQRRPQKQEADRRIQQRPAHTSALSPSTKGEMDKAPDTISATASMVATSLEAGQTPQRKRYATTTHEAKPVSKSQRQIDREWKSFLFGTRSRMTKYFDKSSGSQSRTAGTDNSGVDTSKLQGAAPAPVRDSTRYDSTRIDESVVARLERLVQDVSSSDPDDGDDSSGQNDGHNGDEGEGESESEAGASTSGRSRSTTTQDNASLLPDTFDHALSQHVLDWVNSHSTHSAVTTAATESERDHASIPFGGDVFGKEPDDLQAWSSSVSQIGQEMQALMAEHKRLLGSDADGVSGVSRISSSNASEVHHDSLPWDTIRRHPGSTADIMKTQGDHNNDDDKDDAMSGHSEDTDTFLERVLGIPKPRQLGEFADAASLSSSNITANALDKLRKTRSLYVGHTTPRTVANPSLSWQQDVATAPST
eukprot:m.117815 g.117815  ORF g.117815 m.117815 type:complete len:1082 (-) comp13638_c0_seq3:329-3574(-)